MDTQNLREHVFIVCERLYEKGEKCSVRRVLSEIPEYNSTSSIHPFVKEWHELQQKERDRIRDSYQFSTLFMDALVSETERVNKEVIKQEKEKSEVYKSLLQDATDEVQSFGKKLSDSLNEVNKLQNERQALVNEIEVMQQTKDSEYKALYAESKRLVSEHRQELDVVKAMNSEYKNELTSLRASVAELRTSSSQIERQLAVQQQQQDNLIKKNQGLNDEKIELAKKVAVREAVIVELEKVNKSIDLLKTEFANSRRNY
jgi:chromosome segregation ATPase